MKTVPHTLIVQSRARPESIAIVEEGAQWTFKNLADDVRRAARFLRSHGMSAGDRFAIWAPNSADWIIAAIAGQYLGATLVTLNSRYKSAEAEDILRRTKTKFLFTVNQFLGVDYQAMVAALDLLDLETVFLLQDGEEKKPFREQFRQQDPIETHPSAEESTISDIMFTSGTTGSPKGAMTNHGQNIRVFESFSRAIDLNDSDRYLIVNPFFHSFGYKAGWLSCLIAGAQIHTVPIFEPAQVLKLIEEHKITTLPGAPTIFQSFLAEDLYKNYAISSLTKCTIGATMIPVDLIEKMHHELGIDYVYSAYGLTESSGVVSLCQKGDDFETIAKTCGRALPGTDIKLIDQKGAQVTAGSEGEICVRGFNVMVGYLDDEDATREAVDPDGWLKTGDIGVMDEKGNLKITDRKKDMLIVGGFNVYPAEVEKILLTHEDIIDAAVIGIPDQRLGEVAQAHLVLKTALSEIEIIDWSRAQMANFKVPRSVVIHQALPRNATGKIMKFKLR